MALFFPESLIIIHPAYRGPTPEPLRAKRYNYEFFDRLSGDYQWTDHYWRIDIIFTDTFYFTAVIESTFLSNGRVIKP